MLQESRRTLSRRAFLITGAAVSGALLVGAGSFRTRSAAVQGAETAQRLNSWIEIALSGSVTVTIARVEMGQGTYTSLAMLAAEDLDVPWANVSVVAAPVGSDHANLGMFYRPDGLPGPFMRTVARSVMGFQMTGGSMSVRDGWITMRLAGAAARNMLLQAAAARWGVPIEQVTTAEGVLSDRSGRRAHYAELVEAAAKFDPPRSPTFRAADQYRLVGKRIRRVDTAAKVRGAATFGIDVRLPNMAFAAIRHAPSFGGSVVKVDAAALGKLPGVIKAVTLPNAVAVIADTHWHARSALDVGEMLGHFRFDVPVGAIDSGAIDALLTRALETEDGIHLEQAGNAARALSGTGARIVTAEYRLPFLAHATMEPMNATARLQDGRLEVWTGSQAPDFVRDVAAKAAGVSERRTTVHTTFLGGGFGRRVESDVSGQAAALAKELPGRAVQLLWTREEDMQHDWYRPAVLARLRGALDGQRRLVAWQSRVASPPVTGPFLRRALGVPLGTFPDRSEVGDAITPRYRIPNLSVTWLPVETTVPTGFWRSVSTSYGAFLTESFVDELAREAGANPYLFRRGLLDDLPRHRAVLDLAAEKSGWGVPLEAGRGRGIALHESFGSIVAQVAEVTTLPDGTVRIDRVVAAVDCGLPVNPAGIEAQMQSAIVFGLSAALYGAITLGSGAVEQSNFHDYQMLRMPAMPRIETYIAPAGGPLGGIGEVGTPPAAPAVANAIFSATGKRLRTLPLRLAGVV
jgi:isoquinoline 1-oxidoreductase beta subunit